jgi:hypothetical protein
MQSADSWQCNDGSFIVVVLLHRSPGGGCLPETKMCAIFMAVGDVFSQKPLEMALAKDDDMVEQLPADVANPSLSDAVLPWAAVGRARRLYFAHHAIRNAWWNSVNGSAWMS